MVPLNNRLVAYLSTVKKEGLTIVCGRDGRPADYRTVAEEMRKNKAAMKHPEAQRYYAPHVMQTMGTVSIHAPRRGDARPVSSSMSAAGFDPRPREGGDAPRPAYL